MLKTKCIGGIVGLEDGLRISIMSRHTKNDGITSDPGISPKSYDEWWKKLAPDEKELGAYLRNEMTFEIFEAAYLVKLCYDSKANAAMHRLIKLAREGNVTILCAEPSPEFCHRKILASECKRLARDLKVLSE